MAITRKIPTPSATAPIITGLDILGTWFARTCRSGSEIVIRTPSKKLTKTIIHSLRDLVMHAPTLFPIGVIAVSAPRVKNAIPTISIAAPKAKDTSILFGMGVIVKHSIKTISVIGSTEDIASFSLSYNRFLLNKLPPSFVTKYNLHMYCTTKNVFAAMAAGGSVHHFSNLAIRKGCLLKGSPA